MKIFRYIKFALALWSLRSEALALYKKVAAINLDKEGENIPVIDFKQTLKTIIQDSPMLVTAEGKQIRFGLTSKGQQ